MLIVDECEPLHLPMEYRSAQRLGLCASASGQFSVQTLQNMLDELKISANQLMIVDLRQESHGFINDIPISWYGEKNADNAGLSVKQIKKKEHQLLNELTSSEVLLHEIIKKKQGIITHSELYATLEKGQTVHTEQEVVESQGAHYQRFFVQDHCRADEHTVQQFVHFITQQPSDRWLHFHCRRGRGRATSFLLMCHILFASRDQTLEQLMQQHVQMGGVDLFSPPTEPHKQWKRANFMARASFIDTYYKEYIGSLKG